MNQWLANPSKDLLSGLVVAFAMIPEAIAFSGIAGVDPKVGLFGAFCLSLTIAVVGGRMAMITSATGSTALLMTGLVATGEARGPGLGVQYLMVAGLVTGLVTGVASAMAGSWGCGVSSALSLGRERRGRVDGRLRACFPRCDLDRSNACVHRGSPRRAAPRGVARARGRRTLPP